MRKKGRREKRRKKRRSATRKERWKIMVRVQGKELGTVSTLLYQSTRYLHVSCGNISIYLTLYGVTQRPEEKYW